MTTASNVPTVAASIAANVPSQYVQIGDLVINSCTSEVPEFPVMVTQHPTETGANVSDHARPQLITLALDGVISDIVFDSDLFMSVKEARSYLLSLVGNPVPVKVITPDKTYDQMVVTSLSLPRSKDMGKGQRFSIKLIEWRVVTVKKTNVQIKLAVPAKKGKKPANKLGDPENTSQLGQLAGEKGTGGKLDAALGIKR